MTYPADFKHGDPLPNSAQFFRDVLNVVRQFKRDLLQRKQPDVNSQRIIGHVKNTTDSQCNRYDVLRLGDPVFERDADESDERFIAEGKVASDIDQCGRFAVLLEPVRNNSIGRAVLSGLCVARVDVTDLEHRWADITLSDKSKLTSRDAGGAEIITQPSETGVQLLWVRIGHAYHRTRTATLSYNLYSGDDVAAVLDDGREIRVGCRILGAGGVAANTLCFVEPQSDTDVWQAIGIGDCVQSESDLDSGNDEP